MIKHVAWVMTSIAVSLLFFYGLFVFVSLEPNIWEWVPLTRVFTFF